MNKKLPIQLCLTAMALLYVPSNTHAASVELVSTTQQQSVISGNVKDQQGNPIIGAAVQIKGTTIGTITDFDGNFSFNHKVKPGETIIISFVGMTTREVKLEVNKESYSVILSEDALGMEEVVVVGYGAQKKVNLTGAISSVESEGLTSIATGNLSNTLAGRAGGVNIVGNSGLAGATSSIRIRGAQGDPLFVINNIISSKAAFDALDANEVETINFLKDAASASIYGSKAANGVVLVTTKKGSVKKPEFNYRGAYSFSDPIGMQGYTAEEEIRYRQRVAKFNGVEPNLNAEEIAYLSDKNYNVNDYIWQNPWSTQHNLNVSGGSERVTYYMMFGYLGEEGSYKNLEHSKFNLRSDVTARITDSFKINLNIGAYQRNNDRFYWPYDDANSQTVADIYRATFNWSRLTPYYVDENGNPTNHQTDFPVIRDGYHVPEVILSDSYRKAISRNLEANFRADLDLGKLVKGLSTAVAISYNAADRFDKAYVLHNKAYEFQQASPTNKFKPTKVDPNKVKVHNVGNTFENIQESASLGHSYQFNWYINFTRDFGKHKIDALAAYEQAEDGGRYLWGRAEEFVAPIDQIYATSTDSQRRHFGGNEGVGARASIIGRLNYNYDDRYIVEFSFREDGNAKFGPGNRWGFFPSASAAWRISEEKFFQSNTISNLKVRGSIGTTGNDGSGAFFQWRDKMAGGNSYVFGNTLYKGITTANIPNPDITWATHTSYNAGLDFGLFRNQLTGSVEYFYTKESNILRSRIASVPTTFGGNLPEVNYATRDYKGFEVNLSWNQQINDFSYKLYGNVGYAKDRWVYFDEALGTHDFQSGIGHPSSRIWGFYTDGIVKSQAQADELNDRGFTQFGEKVKPGMILYRDIRGTDLSEGGDGKVTWEDQEYISNNGSPRFNFGFGTNMTWKGLTLDLHFQGVGGYDKMASTINGGGVFQVSPDNPYFSLWASGDVWTEENPNAKYPAASGQWSALYGHASSTFWVENGSFVRLKNLNLSYKLPKRWFKNSGVNNVAIDFNATNLFCFSSFKLYDPEQATMDSYPLMKTFSFGLSVGF